MGTAPETSASLAATPALVGIIPPVRELWSLFSTLAAMAILAAVMVPQTALNAPGKGGAKDGAAPSAPVAAGIVSAGNLKVLTPRNAGITMQNITLALGVACTYCHVEGALPLDTKPQKVKARMTLDYGARHQCEVR
jgi:hypothetical protein